jgi:4-alpha-glucanotransferase
MSYSAIAGNPYLISPEILQEMGLLTAEELADVPAFPTDRVDFERVMPYKMQLLRRAFERFRACDQLAEKFAEFCHAEKDWLEDYALFMALQQKYPDQTWNYWETAIAQRHPQVIARQRELLHSEVQFHQFLQFQFFQQWLKLKEYANQRHIQIIGDIPIYVSHHSVDVWVNPQNFMLNPSDGSVAWMAGVPPDYFSPTGQLWGNPVYNWAYLQETNFAWWIQRFRFLRRFVDLIRIDHFRGFEAFWQVPAGETTAVKGEWRKAPGKALFQTLVQELGELPILAEDLGVITPEVEELRDRFGFPGMRVLLFAFNGGSDNIHLPHHFVPNSVVYTGTHDNDTAVGWWQRASRSEKQFFYRYLTGYAVGEEINWAVIRLALASVSNLAIIPLQDILGLDNSARMNTPATIEGNWEWRLASLDLLTDQISDRLRELTHLYSR